MRCASSSVAISAFCLIGNALAQAQPASEPPQQTIEVVGTSPLPGQGVDRELLPYQTQLLRRSALQAAQADNTSDLMARRLVGVQSNEVQGSPFQADLTFRGYRASGILGAAQGLSVYLDGVRVNEPFGDVVNWDMVPEHSLSSLALVPGANPAFGLNSLGGAMSLTTASGNEAPGVRSMASIGSFGRKRFELSHGAAEGSNGISHYLGVGLFDERGWRDFSDGRLGTAVGKVGLQTELGRFTVSALAGRSRLVGNGLVPLYTLVEGADEIERVPDLGQRREAVYTHPDITRNRLSQASLQWRHAHNGGDTLEALLYSRDARRNTVNGDEAEQITPDSNASFNRTTTGQRSWGAAWAWAGKTGAHQWQFGATLDAAKVRYQQTEQEGNFDASRGVLPIDDEPEELSVDVRGRSSALGIYATDTWQAAAGTHITGTLRLNRARVSNTLASVDDDTNVFEQRPREKFSYRSWNPALGVAQKLAEGFTVFANVARNNRVPTVIELGCADPEEPCRLPAGLQADPYLKQVVATSLEAGLRWRGANGQRAWLALFDTRNRDDILFRSVSVTGQRGYFENFARTRNRGLDAEWQGRLGPVQASAAYSHLRATYEAEGVLRVGERNVAIERGARIAGLPRHVLKLSADGAITPEWSVGADMQVLSRRGVAGNEDGRIEDGEDEAVDLSLPGYAVFNLRATWKPVGVPGLELFARITNVGNRRYASFGALAETAFDAQGNLAADESDALFAAPGAPRAFTLGLRWVF
jgi:outer membrane receptor protein involved in Fe transport